MPDIDRYARRYLRYEIILLQYESIASYLRTKRAVCVRYADD